MKRTRLACLSLYHERRSFFALSLPLRSTIFADHHHHVTAKDRPSSFSFLAFHACLLAVKCQFFPPLNSHFAKPEPLKSLTKKNITTILTNFFPPHFSITTRNYYENVNYRSNKRLATSNHHQWWNRLPMLIMSIMLRWWPVQRRITIQH